MAKGGARSLSGQRQGSRLTCLAQFAKVANGLAVLGYRDAKTAPLVNLGAQRN